jgi:hypothetical protein
MTCIRWLNLLTNLPIVQKIPSEAEAFNRRPEIADNGYGISLGIGRTYAQCAKNAFMINMMLIMPT